MAAIGVFAAAAYRPFLATTQPTTPVWRAVATPENTLPFSNPFTGICSHILDGAPLTVKKTLKSDKRVRAGTEEGTKKRRASEGEWPPILSLASHMCVCVCSLTDPISVARLA